MHLRFEKGELILHPLEKQADPESLALLERIVAERLKPISILDVLLRTEQWLNWTRFFMPLSGHDAKLDDPLARYIAIAFCYGCNLGPSQTARSLRGFDRRHVSWVNQHHITEEKLDEAIRSVITGYNRFHLPKYWGTGKHASADGTKWEMYEQNLLAEYHIRYGGYGGIGYYHVSDTYIALFSHFIPCGVWEGSYILDMFEKEEESIFGGEGVITHNRRIEQRKCIKFNHLVANCLIFYNVHAISKVLEQLNQEGADLDEQAVGALSPYLRQHVNRFGQYQLDVTQPPPALNYDIQVITSPSKKGKVTRMVESASQKRAKLKRKKKKISHQMKLF